MNVDRNANQFVNGWTCGEISAKENVIEFQSENQKWMTIPYNSISNVQLPSKNEIAFEFNADEEDSSK